MADSTGDADADAVLGLNTAAPVAPIAIHSTGDPDADAVIAATGKESTPLAVEPTWGNAVKGVGEAALTLGSGALKGISSAANDILPGDQGRKELAAQINTDPILNYRPGPEAAPILDAVSSVTKPIAGAVKWGHDTIAALAGDRAADVAGDVATLAPGLRGITGPSEATQTALKAANAERDAALLAGQKEGYSVPPASTNPTLVNRGIESAAGKINLQQAASIKNQAVTDALARRSLDLPPDAPLNADTTAAVRTAAGKTYEAVKGQGTITVSPDYGKALDKITSGADRINADFPAYRSGASQQIADLVASLKPPSGTMDSATAVELSKDLRYNANANSAAAARTGDPTLKALSRAQSQAAEVVENEVERHLTANGKGDLAGQWDDARRNIAKSYTVENALDGAGHVDASKLAKMSLKGKPLSPELQTAADFSNAFPKATKVGASKESMPGISPLDWIAGGGIGETAHAAGASLPAAIATGVAIPAARVGARALAMSPAGQKLATPSYLGRLSDAPR